MIDWAATGQRLVIERRLAAPRDLVFAAWTNPAHLSQWSCPEDLSLASVEVARIEAGAPYRLVMEAADGTAFVIRGVYREVAAPSRLVYTAAWEDRDGQPGHETLVTVTFEADGDATRLTLRQESFEDEASRDRNKKGWISTLNRLDNFVTVMSRR